MRFSCHLATLFLAVCALPAAEVKNDLAGLIADRAAVERVYYNHRLGQRFTFEQVLPPAAVERLVKTDLKKEAVLKSHYGVTVTPKMVAGEVHRIDTTTHAPDILAELKAALDNDPDRFARTVARPLVVERELRDRFDNDDLLHAGPRNELENLRASLLAARKAGSDVDQIMGLLERGRSNQVTETSFLLTARPSESSPEMAGADLAEVRQKFGPNAQLLASPHPVRKHYLEDLSPDLQRVLNVQLRQAGDVSAVIEIPAGFLLYVARERTPVTLDVACLVLEKGDYDGWLSEQPDDMVK